MSEEEQEICPNCCENAFYPHIPRCAECGFVAQKDYMKSFQSGDRFYLVDTRKFTALGQAVPEEAARLFGKK